MYLTISWSPSKWRWPYCIKKYAFLALCRPYYTVYSEVCTIQYTVDPVINDPVIDDLLSPTTFFSCTKHFPIFNNLWSMTFCLTRLATSNIWQKVNILLVSNDLNFFRHTTFGNIDEQTTCMSDLTVWISWLTERYNAGRSGCWRKRPICPRR